MLEGIAEGDHILTRVNGKVTADYRDDQRRYTRGCLALQAWGSNVTVAHFRKIEVKKLSKGAAPAGPPVPPDRRP